jgi:hypothetical protein
MEAQDREMMEDARGWALKANRVDPDHALPFVVYYDSFGAMGEAPTDDAVNGLYRAVMIVPQDLNVRIRAGIELLRQGDVRSAQLLMAPAAFQAEGSGENKVLKLMREMGESADKDDLLAEANELKLDRVNEFIPPSEDDEDEQS